MFAVKFRKPRPAYAIVEEGGIMHYLNEPDQTGHKTTAAEVNQVEKIMHDFVKIMVSDWSS